MAAQVSVVSQAALEVQKPNPHNSPEEFNDDAADQLLAAYSSEERDTLRKRCSKKPPKFTKGAEGNVKDVGDPIVNQIRIVEAFATGDRDLVSHLLGQLADTVPYGERRDISNMNFSNMNFVAAALYSIGPRDGLEALLCAQMVGVHNIAMEFLKRAALKEQTPYGLDANVNRATRFLRTFAKQMEVLKAYRSKGEQKVEVEHVHVHRGGQAIVGAVSHGSTGVGNDGQGKQ
jgi:hypothetical protein